MPTHTHTCTGPVEDHQSSATTPPVPEYNAARLRACIEQMATASHSPYQLACTVHSIGLIACCAITILLIAALPLLAPEHHAFPPDPLATTELDHLHAMLQQVRG